MNAVKFFSLLFCVISVLFGVSMLSPAIASAQNTASSQAQCFSTLKENMAEATIFSDPLAQMGSTTYAQLEPYFSQKYKNLESFGISVDQGVIAMRLQSFGRQTGYVHPPKIPFPSSYKSDTWATSTKEYILAEEYVTDPAGREHFLDCVFFQIASEDLMGVTRDRYLYDGPMISLTKDAPSGNYKAWYSENVSFDYQNKPFVTWKRLFIYPESTQNSYFDKYSIADAFPAHKVASLDVLNFFSKNVIQVQDYNRDTGTSTVRYLSLDKSGKMVEVTPSPTLAPITPTGIDTTFPFATYYQAIENRFPEFAKLLSLRGTLKYDTFKKIVSGKDRNLEVEKLLGAIMNYQALASYAFVKETQTKQGMRVSSPEMDGLLVAAQDGDWATQQLLSGATLKGLSGSTDARGSIVVLLSLLSAGVAILIWRKRALFIKVN